MTILARISSLFDSRLIALAKNLYNDLFSG